MSFELVVGFEHLESTSDGRTVGPIHICLDGGAFPESGWWDFPCVVLASWIQTVSSGSSEFELTFFDGPMRIACARQARSVSLKGWTETGLGIEQRFDSQVDAALFEGEILRVATAVVAHCVSRGLSTGGLEKLLGDT